MTTLSTKTKDVLKDRIFKTLKTDRHMTANAVARKLVRSWTYMTKLLKEMEEDGLVERINLGSYTVWRRLDVKHQEYQMG